MKKLYAKVVITLAVLLLTQVKSKAQISILQDYSNKYSAPIGTYQGIKFREAGFSGLYPIPNSGGKEFWTVSDRGVNVDCANANPAGCHPVYDKLYAFPGYVPKIHRIRVNGDSIQILQTITMKRPDGTGASGLLNPTGFGSLATETVVTDTVQNCSRFSLKSASKDIWGIDAEGIVVDNDGNFWLCEEGGASIWKLNSNGVVIKRFSPYTNLSGAQPEDVQIDSCFKFRKNNRGFEGISITPSGLIYAIIQSPLFYPTSAYENSRFHRILEINPKNNAYRMFVYMNDGIVNSGSNQIRAGKDWKIGDMAAINDSMFLVLEAAARGTTDIKKLYQININGASVVTSGLYGGKTIEAAMDSATLFSLGIKPVRKTLVMNLLTTGWPSAYDKAEGLAILNDSTIAICNDNDFGQTCPLADGIPLASTTTSHLVTFNLKGANKLQKLIATTPPVLEYTFATVGCNRVDYLDTAATTGTANATGKSTANVFQLNKLFTDISNLNPLPKFLFLTGDIVMGYTNDTVGLTNQLKGWKAIYAAHPLSKMGIQLVVIPGNHETQDKAAGKKSYIAAERTFLREMAPYIVGSNGPTAGGADALATDQSKLTYSFNYGCDHYIILNTDPTGADAKVPYKWLANDLKTARANNARHIFALGHKPAWSSKLKPLDGLEAFIPQRDSFWKYMELYQVEAMFAAHEHLWDTIHPHAGKTWQVIAGNGGSLVETTWMGAGQAYFGYTLASIYTNNQVNLKSMGRDADMSKYTLPDLTKNTYVRANFNIGLLPVIEHTPLTNTQSFGPVKITARITDDIGVSSAQVNYSVNGVDKAPVYAQIEGSNYTFTIPAQTGAGVIRYIIQANDNSLINSYSSSCASNMHMFSFGKNNGPSTKQTPYVIPQANGVTVTSVLSVLDSVSGYKMAGIPDGLGAYDNGDGTFTLLMNHEHTATVGIPRAHGQKGAFVSKWIIKKSDLTVLSGSDLIQNVVLWDTTSKTWITYNKANPSSKAAMTRFCSADLPPMSAFYNANTGLGTTERLFMNGEENNDESRAFAHIVTGANGGTTYELPCLGKAAWENAVASGVSGDKTVVALTNDGTDGQVYFYIGTKTNNGTEIDKAGLNNGTPWGVKVSGFPAERTSSTSNIAIPSPGTRFSLVNLGNVKNMTGTAFNTKSNDSAVTKFSRPEDGAWDPSNPRDFYFNTTDQIDLVNDGIGTQIGRSRVWRLRFDDVTNPEKGGTIEAVLDGTEGQNMLDNMTIDNSGHILLQEDVGNQQHNGKVFQYTISTDKLNLIAKHDPTRFGDIGIPATSPFNQDEETSGIIDAQNILGPGMFLSVDQAHYSTNTEAVEGGQLFTLYNPETFNSNPEISVNGNNLEIVDGDTTPSLTDYSDLGSSVTGNSQIKTFVIKNAGPGNLIVSGINFSGANGSDFSIIGAPGYPATIPANGQLNLAVKFAPTSAGLKKAVLNVINNDFSEGIYDFRIQAMAYIAGQTGPSSSSSPYVVVTSPGATVTSILTVPDAVGGYKMVGIPDGLGAFDNNNGTFTLLMNQELTAGVGIPRAHGQKGAFVSKWIINKSNLSVVSGSDLIKNVVLWDTTTKALITYNTANPSTKAAMTRFCSADLPPVSAFFNAATGLGTTERIFMNGEENNDESRAFAHIVTGSAAGNSYELPNLGKAAWENAVANGNTGDKTVVALTNDGTDGQVYMYIGTKTNSGLDIDKAGLNNGKPYGIKVAGFSAERVNATTLNTLPVAGTRFSMVDLGNVKNMTGGKFNTLSNDSGVTKFSRPEDGAWDPSNPRDFYFNTTDQIDQVNDGVGTQVGRSRVWRLRFDDITKPEKGGTIEAVLDGTEGQNMLDNMAIDNSGHILLQEDVGNQQHNGKVWQYTIATDQIKQIAKHDPAKFGDVGIPATAPFNIDEETSGIIDAQNILGPGMFLFVDQAHYATTTEAVEGGQLLALFNPDTYNSQAEVSVTGAGINIVDGDLTPDATDNTDFGITALGTKAIRSFVIKNNGPGPLNISSIKIAGNNANEFTLGTVLSYPVVLASGATQTINVNFTPLATGNRVANIQIFNNDLDEAMFDFALQGQGAAAEITVLGNNTAVNNGDVTPGVGNNTDFGWADLSGTGVTKTFEIQNNGYAVLNIYSIQILGDNASDFTIVNAPTFPVSIGAFSSLTITVKFTPTAAGSRFAKIVLNNNDQDEGTYEFVIAGNLSTLKNKSLNENNAIRLYPNPSSEAATVVLNLPASQNVTIILRDLEGKIISKNESVYSLAGENRYGISTTAIPDGMYVVEVIAGNEIYPLKLMVKH